MDSTTNHKSGTPVSGFRITVLREGGEYLAMSTIFSTDVPDEWHQLCKDKTVLSATLRRSGKVIEQYTRKG